jgi:hypothetical protein
MLRPCNVGAIPPTPAYIAERTHKNVHGRSDDRHDETAKQFDEFWRIFPSRGGHTNPKKPAREKFFAAVKRGADPELIVRAAENYAAHITRSNTAGRYVKQAQFWLGQECWEQYGAPEEAQPLRAGMI